MQSIKKGRRTARRPEWNQYKQERARQPPSLELELVDQRSQDTSRRGRWTCGGGALVMIAGTPTGGGVIVLGLPGRVVCGAPGGIIAAIVLNGRAAVDQRLSGVPEMGGVGSGAQVVAPFTAEFVWCLCFPVFGAVTTIVPDACATHEAERWFVYDVQLISSLACIIRGQGAARDFQAVGAVCQVREVFRGTVGAGITVDAAEHRGAAAVAVGAIVAEDVTHPQG